MWEVGSFAHLVANPLNERGGRVLPGEKEALKLMYTAAHQSFASGETRDGLLRDGFRFGGGICGADARFDDSCKFVIKYTFVE